QLALDIYSNSKKLLDKHKFSNTKLDYIGLKILDKQIKVNFTESTVTNLDSIIYTCDIVAQCKEINEIIERQILIKSFNINSNGEIEILSIYSIINEDDNEIFINKTQLENGATRLLTTLLTILISDLTMGNNPVLSKNNIIKIKLSGDE
ncbi:15091_t:CDS:2, partial [Cetraspora pellucida]